LILLALNVSLSNIRLEPIEEGDGSG
jgi:hypothetical protein